MYFNVFYKKYLVVYLFFRTFVKVKSFQDNQIIM